MGHGEGGGSPTHSASSAGATAATGGTSLVATTAAASPEVRVPEESQVERPAAAVLQRLEFKVTEAVNRDVKPEAAADLVNRLRRMGPGAGSEGAPRAATNADLMKGITEADVKAWFEAQGLKQEDVDALRRAAFLSGMPNPTGSFVNNAIQYIASPWVNFAASDKTSWAGAGVGFLAAAVGAPMNAFQQSAVVTLCESIREHGGPVIVPDKNNINDKHWLPELSKKLEIDVKEFSGAHDDLHKMMTELGVAFMGHTDETLKSNLEGHLAPADLQKLREGVERLLNAEKKLYDTQRDFMMTQGAHERQWKGNTWQAIPRTLRAPVAGFAGLVSKSELPRFASATGQTVASVVLTAAQHVTAGLDERSKQDYNNKLNLLYGDFFTASGNEKLKSGQPLEASDIDEKKLRGFVNTPEQSLVKHVSAELKRQIGDLNKLLNDPNAAARPAADVSNDRSALESLEADAKKLKDGKLSELTPGGLSESLLVASDKSVLSPQLWNDVVAKYTMREFSAQTAQRLGQMFHLGVLGSAASSIIGKVTSAASGGVKNAPIAQTAGVSVVSGVMAGIGAMNQHTAISVKNNRREADTDPGLLSQVGRGIMGGASEALSQRKGTQASRDMNALLGQDGIDRMLKFAKDVQKNFGPVPTSVELTLSEAAQQLRPGHASPSAVGEVVIQMGESSSAAAERTVRDDPAATSSRKGKEPMVGDQ